MENTMLMIPIKHLKKDVKKVISNSYREEMKELVTKLHKQLMIRNIKNSKIQNECNELNKNNSNINKEIEVLQLQYNKLRSQLETLINLIVELHKSEKKSLTEINLDMNKASEEIISIHNDYKNSLESLSQRAAIFPEKKELIRSKNEVTSKHFKDLVKKYERMEKKFNNDYNDLTTFLNRVQEEECNGRDLLQLEDSLKSISEVAIMSHEDYSMKLLQFQIRKNELNTILLNYADAFEKLKSSKKEQDMIFQKDQTELDELKKKMNEIINANRATEAVTMDLNNQIKSTNTEKDNVETWVKGIQKKFTTLTNIQKLLENEIQQQTITQP